MPASPRTPRTPRRAASKLYDRSLSGPKYDNFFSPTPSPSGSDTGSASDSDFDPILNTDTRPEEDDKPNMKMEKDDSDSAGEITKSKKRAKVSPKNSPKKVKSELATPGKGGKTGAWSGEEDWHLFKAVHPRVSPNWAQTGAGIGRDAKVSRFEMRC